MQLLQQQNLEVDSTLYVAELIYNHSPVSQSGLQCI